MKRNIQAVFVALTFAACAASSAFAEKQPQMHAAINSLENALTHMQAAEDDKGGHKAKAIRLVKEALAELRAGVKFDNTHDGRKGKR